MHLTIRNSSVLVVSSLLALLIVGCTTPSNSESTSLPVVDQYIETANEMLATGNYEDALSQVLKALDEDSGHPDALVLRGWLAAFLQGDSESGLLTVGRAIDANPEEPLYRVKLAEILIADQRWDEAQAEIYTAERLGELDSTTRSLSAKVAFGRGNPGTSLLLTADLLTADLPPVSTTEGEPAELLLLAGIAALELDDYEAARRFLSDSRSKQTPFTEIAIGRAELGLLLASDSQVVLFDENFNVVEPSAARIVNGLTLMAADPNTDRLLAWDPMLSALVDNAQDAIVAPVVEFTIQLEDAGFLDEAAAILQLIQAWTVGEWKSYSYGERANLLSELGRYQEALDEYTIAIDLSPTWFRYAGRAEVATKLNRPSAAALGAELAIELNPEDASFRIRLARMFLDSNEFAAAAEQQRAALQLGRKDAGTYSIALDIHGAAGQLDTGITLADEAISLFPNNGTFLAYRGSFNHTLGNVEQAELDYDRAAEIDPENPTVYSFRAAFRLGEGDIDGAVVDAEKAIDLGIEEPFAGFLQGIIENAPKATP